MYSETEAMCLCRGGQRRVFLWRQEEDEVGMVECGTIFCGKNFGKMKIETESIDGERVVRLCPGEKM